ncbi:PA2169 family four-helix-bundle protein [Noviherbaspirillum galbum]|uniref:PA2169 family four-helix-bundle protein n=1 Tax=Noviherbaspirillum galbum TaxID=2709383 RepID=A0A6B3SK03_9BURK|nr:PA2169 family four-helix-bundle protein [Noviherbaspirillum galbum]NEX61060.1 PA2169 family four-helix-bundle protein [Noviherbaspirillum galbum]
MDKSDVVSTLNDLIETCKDGEEGFRNCAENISDSELKSYFTNRAQRCSTAAAELQDVVEEYGGKPETSSSISSALHRRWVDIKSAVTGKDDESILNECERGEDVAKRSYENALSKDLPDEVRSLVERQYQGVMQNHDQVKSLRNQARGH